MLANFLSALDPEATGQCYFVEKTVRCGFTQQERQDHHQFWLSNSDAPAHLKSLNEQGYGTHIAVQRTDGSGKRTATNITAVRSLIADLDGAPLEPVLQADLKPHIIVESSPGRYHVYWLVEIGSIPLSDFPVLQEVLNGRFNADRSVKDISHTLRCPGFYHLKREPFLSRIVEIDTAPRYEPAAIYSWLPRPPPKQYPPWNGKVEPLFLVLYEMLYKENYIKGAERRTREGDVFFEITCPNNPKHTANLYLPSTKNSGLGGFKCFHDKCAELTITAFYRGLRTK